MKQIYTYLRFAGVFGLLAFMSAHADTSSLDGFNQLEGDGYFFQGEATGAEGVRGTIINIFRSVSILLYISAIFISVLATIRLLSSASADEESWKKWRSTLIWSLAGLFVLTIAYNIVDVFEADTRTSDLDADLAVTLVVTLVYPILAIMQFFASIAFLFAAIYAYYRIVTAGGDEAGVKAGKQSFVNAIIGFALLTLVKPLIGIVSSGSGCEESGLFGELSAACSTKNVDTVQAMSTIERIITFLNSFVALAVLIMIIYAGILMLTSNGNEERIGTARKVIIYAVVGIVYLALSFLIFRFFLFQG